MDYSRVIEKALSYIELNLIKAISLEDIADEAYLSCYHFHRIFTSHTGYSVKEYIRKRRLSCAGREVVFNTDKLKDIALKYQFETLESFIRAFKKEFGITPGLLRKQKGVFSEFKAINNNNIRINLKKRKEESIMEAKIIEMNEMKVMGLKCTTTMKENAIPQLWCDYMKIFDHIPNKIDGPCFGICMYMGTDECNEDSKFDYIAAHGVTTHDEVPEGMFAYTLPKAKYASFTHKGSLDTLDQTYSYIFGVWANEGKYTIDQKDTVELYDERFKFGEADSEMDILVPIK